MDVISALKRLERVGSESSRSTEKLVEAASCLASAIEKTVDEDEDDGDVE